jgi:hypothetical protein
MSRVTAGAWPRHTMQIELDMAIELPLHEIKTVS